MANTYLTRTGGTATDGKKFTYSVWFKRGNLGSSQELFCIYADNTNRLFLRNNGDTFELNMLGIFSGTTPQFRDTNGWYHFVISCDSTQSTNSDRAKWYLNGELISGITSSTTLNQVFPHGQSTPNFIIGNGEYNNSVYSNYWDGSMSHVHFIDGTAYDATAFGQYDANGVWTIKTSPSVTYGTNGFFILKDGNSVTDQSGNSNNFTVAGGTLTKTEDSPSNVFATINALDNYRFNGTFSNGNNTVASNASVESYWTSSLGASSGKYYWEVKISASGSNRDFIGIADKVAGASDFSPYSGNAKVISYYGYTGTSQVGSTGTAFGATFGTGDIIGVAMDLDNYKIYYSKNGVFQGSGNPTTGANGLAIDTSPASGFYYAQGANIHNTASTFQTNFGNGYFGTTAVASAGTNASGIGIFEFDVPTGFTALSTKGLNL